MLDDKSATTQLGGLSNPQWPLRFDQLRQHVRRLGDITFAPEGRDESPLTEQERACVQWLLDHEAEVASAVLEGLLAEYPGLQRDYGYEGAEREEYMPDVSSKEDFRRLIGLHDVHVHQLLKEGLPYVGYEFGCTWDGEHGLGVLMHGSRVVEVGGADTAITLWIAKRDAGVGT